MPRRAGAVCCSVIISPKMKSTIVAFNQDDVGDWIAELSCGHARHVRHKPPFQSRPWVTEEATRLAMIGEELECGLCSGKGKRETGGKQNQS